MRVYVIKYNCHAPFYLAECKIALSIRTGSSCTLFNLYVFYYNITRPIDFWIAYFGLLRVEFMYILIPL